MGKSNGDIWESLSRNLFLLLHPSSGDILTSYLALTDTDELGIRVIRESLCLETFQGIVQKFLRLQAVCFYVRQPNTSLDLLDKAELNQRGMEEEIGAFFRQSANPAPRAFSLKIEPFQARLWGDWLVCSTYKLIKRHRKTHSLSRGQLQLLYLTVSRNK
jgi:hypothetical protein